MGGRDDAHDVHAYSLYFQRSQNCEWLSLLCSAMTATSSQTALAVQAGLEAHFQCPDCMQSKPLSEQYIGKFKDEHLADFDSDDDRSRNTTQCVKGDCCRCIGCHRLRGRINTASKRQCLQKPWGDLDKNDRAKFMALGVDLYGDELAMALNEHISMTVVTRCLTEFSNSGKYLDEEDMTAKFQKKPKQLEAIWLHAHSMICPVRKIKLWADPEFTFIQKQAEELEETKKRELERCQTIRPKKKAKAKAKAKGKGTSDAVAADCEAVIVDKKLKAADKAKLEKMQKLVEEDMPHFDRLIEKAKDEHIKEHIPGFAPKKLGTNVCLYKQHLADITLAIETDTGDFKVLRDNLKASAKEVKKTYESLDNFVEEALAHIGGA